MNIVKNLCRYYLYNPPKNNQNRSSWIKENKLYFFKVWNKLIKQIFISGGNKYLNGWTGKSPKLIFIAG